MVWIPVPFDRRVGMGEDFGKFDPKFAAAIFDGTRDANIFLRFDTTFNRGPPPLSPLYRESIPRSDAALEIFGRASLIGFACAWYERCFAVCGP